MQHFSRIYVDIQMTTNDLFPEIFEYPDFILRSTNKKLTVTKNVTVSNLFGGKNFRFLFETKQKTKTKTKNVETSIDDRIESQSQP